MNNKRYIYCYTSYVSNIDSFIMSKRPFNHKTMTYYPNETTILLKIVKENNNTYKDEKNILCLNTISHNFTVLHHNKKYYGIGGVSMVHNNMFQHGGFGRYKEGMYLLISDNAIEWQKPKLIIPRHLSLPNECCCFDSQPCFFYNESDNLYYLYHRWNSSKGIRKLQLFKSDNIEDWTNTKAIEVKIHDKINIYMGYIFKEKDIFYGIICYYYYNSSVLKHSTLYNNISCGLISSNDGINFSIINDNLLDFNQYGWPMLNSLHKKQDKFYIYFCTESGLITEYKLLI